VWGAICSLGCRRALGYPDRGEDDSSRGQILIRGIPSKIRIAAWRTPGRVPIVFEVQLRAQMRADTLS
jgi:hypothetical protein